jgi:hypothetical protein
MHVTRAKSEPATGFPSKSHGQMTLLDPEILAK